MELINLQPLWLLLAVLPVLVVFRKSLVERSRKLMLASVILRILAVVLIVLAICRPSLLVKSGNSHIVFLLDVSHSVDAAKARGAMTTIRGEIDKLSRGDSWSLYVVGRGLKQMTPEECEKMMDGWKSNFSDDDFRGRSSLGDAILESRLAFPSGKARRVILFSDGKPTDGDLKEALATLAGEGTDFRKVTLGGIDSPEVAVVSVRPNTTKAYSGEKVRLEITVTSNRDCEAVLKVSSKAVVIKTAKVALKKGSNNFNVDVIARDAGANVWTAAVEAPEDYFPLNNAASCRVDVKGKARVLAMHRHPAEMKNLVRVLGKQDIELDVRTKHGLPETLEKMLEFDAIILADFPATDMSTRTMDNLKKYVADFGGGLVMLGSENSFGLGGYYKTPVEDVLPLISRYEKQKEKASVGIVLVIDKSGSMGGLPIEMAREAGKAVVELLGPRDRVGVIAFDGAPYIVAEMTSASDKAGLCEKIDTLAAGGGTNMYPAMAEGKKLLESAGTKVRHMILLTDGQSMGGDFIGLAQEMSGQGMTVSSVALGGGAAVDLMEQIAKEGKGRFYHTLDPENMPRIFTKETMEASRSSIREEPFLPIKIASGDGIEDIDFKQAPVLLGYVMTQARPTARVLLLTETGEPLLAEKRFGLGKSVAFTSDASPRWAGEWMDWKDFGRFWAQVLRGCIRKEDSSGVSVSQDVRGTGRTLRIEQRDDAGRFVNDAKWTASVMSADNPGGKDATVRQTGNGLYEVVLPASTEKSLTVRLLEKDSGKMKVVHFNEDYPAEYRLDRDADKAFANAADMPQTAAADLPSVTCRREVADWFIIAAIICLIAGVLLRRV